MPASNALVSLDHAKDWAKRLSKHQSCPLSQAQTAVAAMLGHASWHAMCQFYSNQAATPEPVASSPAERESFDELQARQLKKINADYPGLNAVAIEAMGFDLNETFMGYEDIVERARAHEYEGYFFDDAVSKALEEQCVNSYSPPGHLFARSGCHRKSVSRHFQGVINTRAPNGALVFAMAVSNRCLERSARIRPPATP